VLETVTPAPAPEVKADGRGGAARLLQPSAAEWPDTLREIRHDVYQHPEYTAADARRLGGSAAAFCYREDTQVFLQPLVLRPVPGAERAPGTASEPTSDLIDAVSPYGYSGPVSNAPLSDEGFWRRACESLPQCLAEAGVVSCFVRLHPLLPPRLDVLGRVGTVVQHGRTVNIDLRPAEDEQWAQIRSNHRRQIHRARRRDMAVRIDDWQRMDDFVEIYHETMARVGASAEYFFDRPYFESLRAALGDDLHLAMAEHEGQVLAGGLFFTHGGIVQYHLGATRTEHLPEQPIKLIFDQVRLWAGDRGHTDFHLGGGVGGGEDSLFHFKAGFSRDRPAFFTWRLVCDADAYDALVEAAGITRGAGGIFPAYRASVPPGETGDGDADTARTKPPSE
jgi:hypothetical protein